MRELPHRDELLMHDDDVGSQAPAQAKPSNTALSRST